MGLYPADSVISAWKTLLWSGSLKLKLAASIRGGANYIAYPLIQFRAIREGGYATLMRSIGISTFITDRNPYEAEMETAGKTISRRAL